MMKERAKYLKQIIFLCLGAMCLCGCQLTPAKQIFKEAPSCVLSEAQIQVVENDNTFMSDEWPDQEWWLFFEDPQLTELIRQTLSRHPSMRLAEAHFLIANATREKMGAPLFPTMDFEADRTHLHNSVNGIFGILHAADPSYPLTYSQNNIMLNMAYEFDIWKKHANQVVAAIDEMRALEAEAYISQLGLSLSVAQSYFQQQAARSRQTIAELLLKNRQTMYRLTEQQYSQGVGNTWSINRAKEAELTSREYMDKVVLDVALTNNDLQALLAGDFNTIIDSVDWSNNLAKPFPIPCSLPLDLLAHRPDIWAQRWRVEAAVRQVYAAKAGFYPNINMIGLLGLQALTFNPLFSHDSIFGLLYGPAIHLPVFDGGVIRAEFDTKNQEYYAAIAQYETLVLTAVKEVLNALVAVQATAEASRLVQGRQALARENLEIAQQYYDKQLISLTDFFSL